MVANSEIVYLTETDNDVVISGIAGAYPESDNICELADNLFAKIDLITDDDRRWRQEHPEVPHRIGKIKTVNKFDAAFFGIHAKQVNSMDPMSRILLEKTFEAVLDAGYNPKQLKGSKTGVFVGACFSESEKSLFYDLKRNDGWGVTGCSRALFANRISFWLDIHGPSCAVDAACASSLYAFEHGYRAIEDGRCEAAIIGGCNLCLHPYVSLQYSRLGVAGQEGKCKSFDESGNGYGRSEAVVVLILQKRKDARRIYARVVHVKSTCDGYKEQGITHPSLRQQTQLLKEFYSECNIDPNSVDYLEAHGTGTQVGDPIEVNSVEAVLCTNRRRPLKIGAIKSNMGHSETASGMCGVSKIIISFELGIIPPNIHLQVPRLDIEAFYNGKINIVSEATPMDGHLAAVSNFGFGGANCHLLLESHAKLKINGGMPCDSLPRLVVASGRTEEAVDVILKDFEKRPLDVEYVRLMQEIHSENIRGHLYRGYTLISKERKVHRHIESFSGERRPVWFVFAGMGSQWSQMGTWLLQIPVCASAINQCHEILKKEDDTVDLLNVITGADPTIFDNILNSFVGISAIQVALVDLLEELAIKPDGIIGHSLGELGCAYADGCFSKKEIMLASYYRGRVSLEVELIHGMMASVGIGYEQMKHVIPPEIDIACHNSSNNCTISGPSEIVKPFIAGLNEKDIFTRVVDVSNIPYHSRYIAPAKSKLLAYMNQALPSRKLRSEKWICTSRPESEWNEDDVKYSCAKYYTNNLINSVYFEKAAHHIPENAITIEIAPHGLLQAILRRSLGKSVTNIALTNRRSPNMTNFLITSLGKFYQAGANFQLHKLYPPVNFPVSRGTPMISPLIRWQHSDDWFVASYKPETENQSGGRTVFVTLMDEAQKYLAGHCIDGRLIYPATGYLMLVWETLSITLGQEFSKVSVVFEDVRFEKPLHVPEEDEIILTVTIYRASGNFEVIADNSVLVLGKVYVPENVDKEFSSVSAWSIQNEIMDSNRLINSLNSEDVYKELRIRGYNYSGIFRGITRFNHEGTFGRILWNNNFVTFLDNMLQFKLLTDDTRNLKFPVSIRKVIIDASKHLRALESLDEESPEVPVYLQSELSIIKSAGIEIRNIKTSSIARRPTTGKLLLQNYQFVPYICSKKMKLEHILRICIHIAVENLHDTNIKVAELVDDKIDPEGCLLASTLIDILEDLPTTHAQIVIFANKSEDLLPLNKPKGVTMTSKGLSNDQDYSIIVASNILSNKSTLTSCYNSLKPNGYLLTQELKTDEVFLNVGFNLCSDFTCGSKRFLLLNKVAKYEAKPLVVEITDQSFSWVIETQQKLNRLNYARDQKLIIYCDQQKYCGILGFFNCLKKEVDANTLRCFFILDKSAPKFSTSHPFYVTQLAKNLLINVYENGRWGCYRHLPIENINYVKTPHVYITSLSRGDLTSLQWIEGPLKPRQQDTHIVHVYYASINFRDIIMATGGLASETLIKSRLQGECTQGFEYAGKLSNGQRVMGMVPGKAMASIIEADPDLMWDVPDEWTLEEAATVPVVYATVLHALIVCGHIKQGESILIHAGSGGVGQAAINICLQFGCTIFTTVGTEQKRKFIRETFPSISDDHIGNSRDTSFEQLIMKQTKGKGVDLVLNSLADDKLKASVRCLGYLGRFLEIGRVDISKNTLLGLEDFEKELTFCSLIVDTFFHANQKRKSQLKTLLGEAIAAGLVKPLIREVFDSNEVEAAFRYMAAGKHIGKVMLKIREEETVAEMKPEIILRDGISRFACCPQKSYIICGGLGGFGLELADWLILRGARNLILVSRKGVVSGYQTWRLKLWQSYGVNVVISTNEMATEEDVKQLLHAAKLDRPVAGIFNLAVVLEDALFENQSEKSFRIAAKPKSDATRLLDKLSRQLCPELETFVVFSSIVSGYGNIGQTNYGMANSVIERICEARRSEALPAVAVQWGAVADVGIVAEMTKDDVLVIGGTLPQSMSSCLESLDVMLRQTEPIVSCMVVADKQPLEKKGHSIIDTVANILGIRNLNTISMHSTLAELGADSMMNVEIKQILDRELKSFFSLQDMRRMTFAKLKEWMETQKKRCSSPEKEFLRRASITCEMEPEFGKLFFMDLLQDETIFERPIVRIPSLLRSGSMQEVSVRLLPTIFFLPGVEGVAQRMEAFSKNIKAQVLCLQYNVEDSVSIERLATNLLPLITERVSAEQEFCIVGYSFGGLVAMELVKLLEAENRRGHLWLIDSSPEFLKILGTLGMEDGEQTNNQLQMNVITYFLDILWPEAIKEILSGLDETNEWNKKLDYVVARIPTDISEREQHLKAIITARYYRIIAALNHAGFTKKSFETVAKLIKPSVELSSQHNLPNDYGLSRYFKHPVEVHTVEGNHYTVLKNKKIAELVMT